MSDRVRGRDERPAAVHATHAIAHAHHAVAPNAIAPNVAAPNAVTPNAVVLDAR
jgi:hypothetical protein